MVDRKVLGHAIVEVPGLDGGLVLIEPVHGVPPGLTLIGRHNVVGLADLAGDVILGPGAGVASSVKTTLAGATGQEDAARQVQLHQLVFDLDEVVSVGLIFPKLDATCLSLIKQHSSHYV